jgi:excinuclease ABC subunit A
VGTATEIHDHLRLLFARVGQPHCPECGVAITRQTVAQMTDRILDLPDATKLQILAPVVRGRRGAFRSELEGLRRQGFVRVRVDGEVRDLSETPGLAPRAAHDLDVVVDRLTAGAPLRGRIAESLETALRVGDGLVRVDVGPGREEWLWSERNACTGCETTYPEISPRLFSFNSPHGACPGCAGLGTTGAFDPARIVPDPALSLNRGAVQSFGGRRRTRYYDRLVAALAAHFEVDPDAPWRQLPERARKGILFGSGDAIAFDFEGGPDGEALTRRWDGALGELARRWEAAGDAEREELGRFRSQRRCPDCDGTRLRREARSVRVFDTTIAELAASTVEGLAAFLDDAALEPRRREVAQRILREIRDRLRFLCDVGVGYLTLDRASATLSGGEAQRIRLATQMGASLVGVLYILDEPSIGLHPRDNERLLAGILRLRDLGNSVVVVEHDEAAIRAADHVIDLGPGAGIHGGAVVAAGPPAAVAADPASATGAYLSGRARIPVPERRRAAQRFLTLAGCRAHNLKDVTLRLPLGVLTVVTGVSGSGKSSLVNDTLHRVLAQHLHGASELPGAHAGLDGIEHLDKVILVDQAPIGRTPRSNPATYTGIFDGIRQLLSQVPEARVRGYGKGRFSFNVKGGRCEACQGDGVMRIEMHFLPDLEVPCDACGGRRYDRETLEVRYKGRNIADILDLTVDEALDFFENVASMRRPLQTLHDVGLGYLRLGQAATTLSGGEAQRVKLARELSRRGTGRTLYLLDEPTTGLHFDDVRVLMNVLDKLVQQGNTVVVVEHHLDVIKQADHVVDLGPEGGGGGGAIVVAGTPEAVARHPESHTGRALAPRLAG